MPKYGQRSKSRLGECHEDLQTVFNEVINVIDTTILEGHRGEARQNQLFTEGKSKLEFPHGKHNRKPSHAVDAAPYPVDWEDTDRWYYWAGIVRGIAHMRGIKLRWGGDWDGDTILDDQTFNDLPHFEITG
jgi:peptidoglycan LD-endopeptidase CwlK